MMVLITSIWMCERRSLASVVEPLVCLVSPIWNRDSVIGLKFSLNALYLLPQCTSPLAVAILVSLSPRLDSHCLEALYTASLTPTFAFSTAIGKPYAPHVHCYLVLMFAAPTISWRFRVSYC
ncbi:hypothetical protein IW261DRAFT_1469576 [Armillaria novae-zelandiae]|uniref:Uncharacterized protein n=1 Tax=Armillaria novae-zelandiae TaxID=153914 RepID=A0AA39PEK3_9AGAR|nr:hypothetical protein IW261DRAFT_1469576 [Armillaria novae-zelandiae]